LGATKPWVRFISLASLDHAPLGLLLRESILELGHQLVNGLGLGGALGLDIPKTAIWALNVNVVRSGALAKRTLAKYSFCSLYNFLLGLLAVPADVL
jgi:hypothetical protein